MIKKALAFLALPILVFVVPSVVGFIWGAEVLGGVLLISIAAFVLVYLIAILGLAGYDIFYREVHDKSSD